jgi:hypothetical protein
VHLDHVGVEAHAQHRQQLFAHSTTITHFRALRDVRTRIMVFVLRTICFTRRGHDMRQIFNLTITHDGRPSFGERQDQERSALTQQLRGIADAVASTAATRGEVLDHAGEPCGLWRYFPQANS